MTTSQPLDDLVRDIARQEVERRLHALEARLARLEASQVEKPLSGLSAQERVFIELARRGGRVTPEEWRAIGREAGYDPRGLGGFFIGRHPSVRWTEGRAAVELTEEGRRIVDQALLRRPPTAQQGFGKPPPLCQWGGKPLSEYVKEGRR